MGCLTDCVPARMKFVSRLLLKKDITMLGTVQSGLFWKRACNVFDFLEVSCKKTFFVTPNNGLFSTIF